MRQPDELTPDELATLRTLWDLYPDEVLSDHGKLDPLTATSCGPSARRGSALVQLLGDLRRLALLLDDPEV